MRDFNWGRWAVLGLMLAAPGMKCSDDESDHPSSERERIEKGLALSPVSINLDGKDRDMVGLGSYLVNAQAACNDCHTHPALAAGGDAFRGETVQINSEHFLAGGTPFGPSLVSPNITPDASGNPAGLPYEGFLHLIRTGTEDDGSILQVMPWPIYKNMTDRDLRAIYEYLRAVPHAEPGP